MPDVKALERLIRDLVRREQIGNTLSAEVRAIEVRLFREIERLLRRIDPMGVSPRYRRGREQKFLAELRNLLRNHKPEVESYLKDHLARIGRAEALAARDGLIATLGTVGEGVTTPITQARMRAILNTDPFQGRTLSEHLSRIEAGTLDKVRSQLRLGMANEESIPDIARRIRGRRVRGAAAGFRGGVMETTVREAEALTRTAVTFVSNEGMKKTFAANADVLDGMEFSAVLDSRTTEICLALDGTVWKLGDPKTVTPGSGTHYQCRSTLLPVIAWKRLGLEPPPELERAVRDLSDVDPAQYRRSVTARRAARGSSREETLGKVVRQRTTADRWFMAQPKAAQDAMVGPGRAELLRSGQVGSLRDLIRGDNSRIPLDQLLRN